MKLTFSAAKADMLRSLPEQASSSFTAFYLSKAIRSVPKAWLTAFEIRRRKSWTGQAFNAGCCS